VLWLFVQRSRKLKRPRPPFRPRLDTFDDEIEDAFLVEVLSVDDQIVQMRIGDIAMKKLLDERNSVAVGMFDERAGIFE
jgi:hypothetical protein